ncbi:MAG: hypothetical protein LBM69_01965 [Lachnospiraceae bacterium]|jgi:hypothetical protein|nr:hypothetical protein [Lachnospiraceae bacterium]
MKRFTVLMLTGTLLFTLASCGATEPDTSNPSFENSVEDSSASDKPSSTSSVSTQPITQDAHTPAQQSDPLSSSTADASATQLDDADAVIPDTEEFASAIYAISVEDLSDTRIRITLTHPGLENVFSVEKLMFSLEWTVSADNGNVGSDSGRELKLTTISPWSGSVGGSKDTPVIVRDLTDASLASSFGYIGMEQYALDAPSVLVNPESDTIVFEANVKDSNPGDYTHFRATIKMLYGDNPDEIYATPMIDIELNR